MVVIFLEDCLIGCGIIMGYITTRNTIENIVLPPLYEDRESFMVESLQK